MLHALEKENETKMPKEMWKSKSTSEELAVEYEQWRHAMQKEHAEWEKSVEDIPEESKLEMNALSQQEMDALSRELAKCPCLWEHMNAFRILMTNKPDADNTAVEQYKTNESNKEFHNFNQEMARHYDEWFKKAVQHDNWLSLDNTVAEQSKTNENNKEFCCYEAAKIKEYEDWFEAKKHGNRKRY